MTLYEKIISLYPQLKSEDFRTVIAIQDNSDGTLPFIAKWEHPEYPKPTQQQLDALE
jgi:hypothetical protein